MKYIVIHDQKYLIMKNEKDAIEEEELEKKITEYFDDFDSFLCKCLSFYSRFLPFRKK